MSQTNPNSLANLYAGDTSRVERSSKGKFESSRAEMGRTHALEILNDEHYRKQLKARMIAGEGGAIEVWLWRIGYGDPPKAREDDTEDQARFDRMRARMREFMKSDPEAARLFAEAVSKQPKLLHMPASDDPDPTPQT